MLFNALQNLIEKLHSGQAVNLGAISWAPPILFFGQLKRSNIATLGLNPSNLEFLDHNGKELTIPNNRFETLNSLNLRTWAEISHTHLSRILESYDAYFLNTHNPYNLWFKKIDKLLNKLGVSYYDTQNAACHLDIVPFSTTAKWSMLKLQTKRMLVDIGRQSLLTLFRESTIDTLILNGAGVINTFEYIADIRFQRQEIPEWQLNRSSKKHVKGYSVCEHILKFSQNDIGRPILVLGFSHNIQSSFGISNNIVNSIGDWLANINEGRSAQ